MSLSRLEFDKKNIAKTMLHGKAGEIETVITQPQMPGDTTPIAIISHPHPLYGGTMNNKVVHMLEKSFLQLDAITIRFNFRGVGQSEGKYNDGIGEAEDLQLIVAECKKWRPQAPVWLAGFSFGAYVTTRAQTVIQAERVLLVAPPLSMYPFDELEEITCPWMVIQGGQDEVISATAVKDWVAKRPNPPQFIWMEEAGHFFHGKLIELRQSVVKYWSPYLK